MIANTRVKLTCKSDGSTIVFDAKIDDTTEMIAFSGHVYGNYIEDGEDYPFILTKDGMINFGSCATEAGDDQHWRTSLNRAYLRRGEPVDVNGYIFSVRELHPWT